MTGEVRLPGGADRGASRRGGVVRRVAGPWTPAVHDLLAHLAAQGFGGVPRPVRLLPGSAVSELTYLEGETVGDRRPWPGWVHSDDALVQVGAWLARYHRAVQHYRPPADAAWRETHDGPGPGVVIAHNDAAPYNAVWSGDRLVGFIDWDMAGPRSALDDLSWVAFSWVPLHAEHVVAAEGFTAFDRRYARLESFLRAYGAPESADRILVRVGELVEAQIALMMARADAGDESYRRMLDAGRGDDLAAARDRLATIRP